MTALLSANLLFDDLGLLQQHMNRGQLMASSVNSNCDCSSAPIAFRTDGDSVGTLALTADCAHVGSPVLNTDRDS